MAYTSFTLPVLYDKFGLKEVSFSLFDNIEPLEASSWLLEAISHSKKIPLLSEKARSEQIVSPILTEVVLRNEGKVGLYSGVTVNADEDNGLNGECDFFLSSHPSIYSFSTPIFSLVEAKENNIKLGLPQCIAQMLGARIFNQKNNHPLDRIYGCVTTGEDWLFLYLEENTVYLDDKKYFLVQLPEILGLFQFIINQYI